MEPFLKLLAKQYLKNEKDDIYNFCFIFPNRRSGLFFKKHLEETNDDAFISPQITTISDFVSDISETIETNRIELLLALYEQYEILAKDADGEIASFDQFIFWGDMLLNDFNDIDKYLANAHDLFSNIKEIKEINSTYLTQEQIEVLNEFFGAQISKDYGIDTFWTHINNNKDLSDNVKSFVRLWEILYPLYSSFSSHLESQGKAYSGMIYRKAIDKLKGLKAEELEYRRYIFVGFNILSTSEYKIFKILQDKGIADFYWDYNNPFLKDKYNKGGKFIKEYARIFKSKYTLEPDITTYPKMEIISIPSNVGQVKYISTILKKLIEKNLTNIDNAINTAIVLPDESLFIPVLSSIPEEFKNVNITMGYPVKYTSIATLISTLSILHNRARKEKDEWVFFHEDVKNILAHPYIKAIESTIITDFIKSIQRRKLFTIKATEIREICPLFNDIFRPLPELNNKKDVIEYLNIVVAIVEKYMNLNIDDNKIELGFITKYKSLISQLIDNLDNYNIELHGKTFFFLIERILNSSTITFEGEPLSGLQIMGVLETRCLDFDNIIVLSMNERIFPRKHFSKSFIPNNLRQFFGLATTEHQECIYTYYFYRMLSRCSSAHLLYDSRTKGISSGEASRYLQQIKFLYTNKIPDLKLSTGAFTLIPSDEIVLDIRKTPEIMEKLNKFRTKDSGKFLSASSINSYIDCPIKFYLQKIEGLYVEDEMNDFIDSATFGTIIHDVMKEIYVNLQDSSNNRHTIIDSKLLNAIKKSTVIDKYITIKINEHYLKKGKDNSTEVDGEALLIADIIKYYIEAILDYDATKVAPFELVQAEEKESGYWDLGDGIGINFVQFIDRIDRRLYNDGSALLRIVDYKTGNDEVSVKNIDNLFIPRKDGKRCKGILQLFAYCNYYSYYHGCTENIQPVLYKIKEIKKNIEFFVKEDKANITDYQEYNNAFRSGFKQVISEIFDPKVNFKQAEDSIACKYCDMKIICRR
ncbi:MAG: PD-(D/E)XK nuclease family protein [Muribaculaceae bacterium]|nr:PD-(D/E)XK nuclease family protein [Muribaculaceae bacterium]